MNNNPTGTIDAFSCIGRHGNRGTPGTERVINLMQPPSNRHDKRARKKNMKKYLSRKQG